jgi:cytochrome c5
MRYALSGIAILSVLMTQPAPAASPPDPAAAGQNVYAKNCASCHRNENPKIGDKAAWKPLIAKDWLEEQ